MDPPRIHAASTLQGLMKYPTTSIQKLTPFPWMMENLKRCLVRGINMTTAYSGVGAPEVAAALVLCGATEVGLVETSTPGFHFVEACDNKVIAQKVLLRHPAPIASKHLFMDLNDRIGTSAKQLLDNMEARPDDPFEAKKAAFDSMESFLLGLEESQQLFRKGRRRPCLKHRQPCFLNDRFTDIEGTGLSLHVAGVTCKDYSKRKRHAIGIYGPSGRPLLLWIFERRFEREDVVLIEKVDGFDDAAVVRLLGPFYDIFRFRISPEDLGWWVSRKRIYILLVLKSSPFKFKALVPDFFTIFGCNRPTGLDCARGEMFYAAPDAAVQAVKAKRWGVKFGKSSADTSSCSWSDILSASQDSRRLISEKQFLDKWAGSFGLDLADALPSSMGRAAALAHIRSQHRASFIADLDHNEDFGTVAFNNSMPCLISHGEYYSSGLQRGLIGMEFFAAQGFLVFDLCDFMNVDPDEWGLTEWQLKDLAGNSMSVPVVHALLIFILADLEFVDGKEAAGSGVSSGGFGLAAEAEAESDAGELASSSSKKPRLEG